MRAPICGSGLEAYMSSMTTKRWQYWALLAASLALFALYARNQLVYSLYFLYQLAVYFVPDFARLADLVR